jgi:SAM-dependent methyltransferase
MASDSKAFDELIAEAIAHPFSGWDFTFLRGRMCESALPWDYVQKVRTAFASALSLLDMGTGGGEFLASLVPLPSRTHATEAYAPNIPVARARLEPLGVRLHLIESEGQLPFPDGSFDLVINRHESFVGEQVFRVLRSGGRFITQQVGERNLLELNMWLEGKTRTSASDHQMALADLRHAGFDIVESGESLTDSVFLDVGAVVYYLKAVPWQVPGFSVEKHHDQLRAIHYHILATGRVAATAHRFFVVARKP